MDPQAKRTKLSERIRQRALRMWQFFSYDIWRLTDNEVSGVRHALMNIAKTIILSVRFFINDSLQEKASALTYNTMLAIVPVLALLLAISRGFGFQDLIEKELLNYFPGQEKVITFTFEFVDNYLKHSQSGIIVGIGLVFLLWAVISLIGNVEVAFNHIWQVKRTRNMLRKVSDYISMILVVPVLMICSSGLSIFVQTSIDLPYFQFIFGPMISTTVRLAPYVITCLLFTVVYMAIPNTRVRFINAFWAGLVAGIAFQAFQYFYISGQIWVSKYNAIYGSFAVLPLLLLWVQLSWLICLFGCELAYASQNIRNFNFEQDANNISRRYYDFIMILIATLVVKRFERQEPPLTTEELSANYQIPSKLTAQIIGRLVDIGILCEVSNGDDRIHAWMPAMDIHQITVGLVIQRNDEYGSEDFKVDREYLFSAEWRVLLESRRKLMEQADTVLLMNL